MSAPQPGPKGRVELLEGHFLSVLEVSPQRSRCRGWGGLVSQVKEPGPMAKQQCSQEMELCPGAMILPVTGSLSKLLLSNLRWVR